MKQKANGSIQRSQNGRHIQGDGPNWILIAGSALLSTLSIRLYCRLKQTFEAKQLNKASNSLKANGKPPARRRLNSCPLHANMYGFTQDEDTCYHCLSGMTDGMADIKRMPTSPTSNKDLSLPLVTVPPTVEPTKENGMMWSSSPERIELPRRPFHHSNSSDSPCVSESGSDIFSKREVIQKLRQQLKRRDDMILEMQTQITDLQNSLGAQLAHSPHLQSQLDSANRDLFDSEREIQRLRKAIADHCVAEMGSPKKSFNSKNQYAEIHNGQMNGYMDTPDVMEFQCNGRADVGRGDRGSTELLKRENGDLKEVIEGDKFLLQSYKDQNIELRAKVKELQLRLSSQVPNIL
ncbi:hypothetical protein QJS10_CPB20g01103 [Acorus calamus]|uniref:Uncharacterized protein n=1 Tax=Acorus calamus TaxID=4465 RepID=A0AAV9CCN9_ACOCL|nr:hypothetical protein QJS10_CPB20g01103 [Acorus calamus]